MKKVTGLLLSAALVLAVAGCGRTDEGSTRTAAGVQESTTQAGETADVQKETAAAQKETAGETTGEEGFAGESSQEEAAPSGTDPIQGAPESDGAFGESRVLIVYFSVPEDVDISGVDAVAGASVVVRDGEKLGNTEYVAGVIQETIGGDLFRIETVESYPLDHEPLVDQAANEQDENARPALASQIENLEQYETILLGYPNWWGDLPMPLYSFLEEYDLGGKTVIPFVIHGGSRTSGTLETISRLEPDAKLSDNVLVISRDDVADSENTVKDWANSLAIEN